MNHIWLLYMSYVFNGHEISFGGWVDSNIVYFYPWPGMTQHGLKPPTSHLCQVHAKPWSRWLGRGWQLLWILGWWWGWAHPLWNKQAMFTWKPFSSDDWQWDLCEGWGPGRTHPPMERRRVRRRSLLSPPAWDPLLGPTLITVKAQQLRWPHFRNLILRPWLYVRGTANHVMIIMLVRDQTYLFLLDCILVVVAPGRHYPPLYI